MSTNVDIVSDVKYYLLHKYRRLEIYHLFFRLGALEKKALNMDTFTFIVLTTEL